MKSSVAKHYGCKRARHCGLIANGRSQANRASSCAKRNTAHQLLWDIPVRHHFLSGDTCRLREHFFWSENWERFLVRDFSCKKYELLLRSLPRCAAKKKNSNNNIKTTTPQKTTIPQTKGTTCTHVSRGLRDLLVTKFVCDGECHTKSIILRDAASPLWVTHAMNIGHSLTRRYRPRVRVIYCPQRQVLTQMAAQ